MLNITQAYQIIFSVLIEKMKKSTKVGAIFGTVGGTLMIIGGILGIMGIYRLDYELKTLDLSGGTLSSFLTLFTISIITTIIFGVIGLSGSILGLKNIRSGFILLNLIGITTIIGMFVNIRPSEYLDVGGGSPLWLPPISLSSSFLFVDPFIILIGGVVGTVGIFSKTIDQTIKVKKPLESRQKLGILLIIFGTPFAAFSILSMLGRISYLHLTLMPAMIAMVFILTGAHIYLKQNPNRIV